jgi:hypothetical protein
MGRALMMPSDFIEQHSYDFDLDDDGDNSEPLVLKPITITGHLWCHISSVEYQVWVKKDSDQKINLDDNEKSSGVSLLMSNFLTNVMFSSGHTLRSRWKASNWQSDVD